MMITANKQSGFSLVEVLVAITLLLLVVTGPMTIISRANNSTAYATEQINAFFLAQEGIELAQKSRDDLILTYFQRQIIGSGGITNPMARFTSTNSTAPLRFCYAATGCGLTISDDGQDVDVKNCNTAGGCRLYTDDDSDRSKYVHISTSPDSGQTETPFTRTIYMDKIMDRSSVREIKVTSVVTWRTGSLIADQRVELVTYLANVYDTN